MKYLQRQISLKGYFHHEMDCGGETQRLMQNQITFCVSVAQLGREADISCDFPGVLCVLDW